MCRALLVDVNLLEIGTQHNDVTINSFGSRNCQLTVASPETVNYGSCCVEDATLLV